jgi:hypothetical protein
LYALDIESSLEDESAAKGWTPPAVAQACQKLGTSAQGEISVPALGLFRRFPSKQGIKRAEQAAFDSIQRRDISIQ